jgi:hypothetical protein
MEEKELQEIEDAYKFRSETYGLIIIKLIAEVRRLNDNIWFKQGDVEELQQENQRLKEALEELFWKIQERPKTHEKFEYELINIIVKALDKK